MKRFKQLLSCLLVFAMISSIAPTIAFAVDDDNTVAYAVEGGNIYFDTSTGTVTDCDESVTSVVIPKEIDGIKVVGIGEAAFNECYNLTNVIISNGISSIGKGAFFKCWNLSNIQIPSSITNIGDSAFYECDISQITIPNGIESIGNATFEYCEKLSAVQIPSSVRTIGEYAFDYCKSLSKIEIPDSVVSIGISAFSRCTNLTSFKVPENIPYIRERTFDGCEKLTDIDLSRKITFIGASAFNGCSNLAHIVIPDGVKSIGMGSFSNCSRLNSITMPDSITQIGVNAFNNCVSLNDVYYAGDKEQWKNIHISYGNPGDGNKYLENATIHYNSTGSNLPTDNNTYVRFFSSWNAENRMIDFDCAPNAISPNSYTVADTVNTDNFNDLVNHYVLVTTKQGDSVLDYIVTDIQPVESAIGEVTVTGEHSLTIDGTEYSVRKDFILGSYDGQELLYHIYNGTIMGFDTLETKTGTLDAWDSTTGQITIDGTVYPTNYLSDLSFQNDINKYIKQKIKYSISENGDYRPFMYIDELVKPEIDIAVFSTKKSLTVQKGDSMWLGFCKISDGQLLDGWSKMAIVVSDPTIISLSEYKETEFGYALEVTGKKQGATNVVITDTESGASTIVVITVRDSYVGTYSYAIDYMKTFYPNNTWEKRYQPIFII